MLDIGWSELLVIAVVLIVIVGPKDLPPMIRAFGKTMASLRKMAGDFRSQFDGALKEADMDDVRQTISDVRNLNPTNSLRDAMNPLRQLGNEIKSDLQKATAAPDGLSSTPAPAVRISKWSAHRSGSGFANVAPASAMLGEPGRCQSVVVSARWNEASISKIGTSSWLAVIRRVLNDFPSRVSSTTYSTSTPTLPPLMK